MDSLQSFDALGPHRLPQPASDDRQRTVNTYLLDGFQRISTLFIAFSPRGSKAELVDDPDADEGEDDYYYDLKSQDFLLAGNAQVAQTWLPLHIVLDSVRLLRFQRGIAELPKGDLYIERSDHLATAFREYKIPVIPIVTDDLAQATLTFQRINSQGTPMSEVHMVNALTWEKDFDFREQLDDCRVGLAAVGWEGLDERLILFTCKALLGLDIYGVSPDEVSAAIRARPFVLREAVDRLKVCARFLTQACGILSPRLVPYSVQIVLLAKSLPRVGLDDLDRDRVAHLADWFWLSTYWGIFPGMSSNALRAAMGDLHSIVGGSFGVWSVKRAPQVERLPRRFDFRTARLRALTLRLAELGPVDSRGERFNAHQVLADHEANAVVQLIPREQIGRVEFASPGNRVLADPVDAASLREAILSRLDQPGAQRFLESHAISREAAEHLRRREYDAFVHVRTQTLTSIEAGFIEGVQSRYFHGAEES